MDMKTISVLLLFVTNLAQAAVSSPKQVVETIFTKASQQEIANNTKLQSEVNQLVSFPLMAKAVLGKHKIPAGEQAWFESTLTEIITRTVYPAAPDFLKNVRIEYKEVDTKGKQAVVKSTVRNKADLTDVNYDLIEMPDRSWQVVDIAIDGESWVKSIRAQVDTTIKQKKWKGLKDLLTQRLNKLKQEG
jgi:ABC-type transporter MlaC component